MKLDIIYLLIGKVPVDQFREGGVNAVTSNYGNTVMFNPDVFDSLQTFVDFALLAVDGWEGYAFLTEEEYNKLSKIL